MAALISSVMNTKDKVPFYVNACHDLGDRRAAARREHVDDRLRGRRGEDPLRAERGEERRRVGVPRDRARARGRRRVRVDLGLHRARRPAGREQARARVARQVRRARLDRRAAPRDARRASSRRSRGGRSSSPTSCSARARSSTSASRPATPRRAIIPRSRRATSSRRASCCKLEKETLGLYVSEHPLTAIRDQLRRKTDCALNELERRRDGEVVIVGGIVSSLKQMTTKKGDPMVFARLEDVTGSCEVVAFNSVYAAGARAAACWTAILIVKGRIDHKQAGRDEARRARGDRVRGDARAARGAAEGRRAHRARPASCASSPRVVKDFPGEAPVYRRPRHVDGLEAARARAELPRAAGAGLLRRGEGPARRSGRREKRARPAGYI